jgi:dihydroorotate dehydrogenase
MLHRLLLLMPPEVAHHVGVFGLRLSFIVGKYFGWSPLPRLPAPKHIEIEKLPGLKFRNRVGLAAGFDKNAEAFPGLVDCGFGFVEVGTVTPKPQPGNPPPRLWRVKGEALVNHLGFNSQGLDAFELHLRKFLPARVPVLANIGKNKETPNEQAAEDYRACLTRLDSLVDGFVINLSSPNTPGLRNLQNEAFVSEILKDWRGKKPILLKLAPDLSNAELTSIAGWVESSPKIAGLVVTNTSRALAEQLGRKEGGLSGRPLFTRALECVTRVRPHMPSKVLIGVGGISSLEDAKKMRAAGADLVEIYTAFIYQGPSLIRAIADDLA